MKTATYTGLDGQKFTVEYDETLPCVVCGLPVEEASMGGTNVCPWCDCGRYRDGCDWHYRWDTPTMRMVPVFPHPDHLGAMLLEHGKGTA